MENQVFFEKFSVLDADVLIIKHLIIADLHFKLDRNLIDSVGRPAVNTFLAKLQAYKSTGDFEGGKRLFESYGVVGDTVSFSHINFQQQKYNSRSFTGVTSVLLAASRDVSLCSQIQLKRTEKSHW